MNFDRVTDIVQRAQLAAGDKAGSADSASADREKIQTVAAQFESMLLSQMLKEMRKSESWDDESEGEADGLGAESFFETLDVELATHLAKVKGFGLSKQMVDALGGSEQGQTSVRPGSDQVQIGVEDLNATVGAVADVDEAFGIGRNRVRRAELPRVLVRVLVGVARVGAA